jgi:HTH-type transcriptional regulator/antitoxin HipB
LDNTPLSLGRALRERRKKLGLTQLDAAELADVSVRFVHDCEAGKATVQLDRVQALATALGLSLTLSLREPGQPTHQEPTR